MTNKPISTIVLSIIILTLLSISAYADLTDDIVAYYDFEEENGTTITDISGNGNNGTINTAKTTDYTWNQSSNLTNIGNGILFDDMFWTLPSSINTDTNSAFTWACWIKANSSTGAGYSIVRAESSDNYRKEFFTTVGGTERFWDYGGGTYHNWEPGVWNDDTELHFWVWTYSSTGTAKKIYIDNTLKASSGNNYGVFDSNVQTSVGGYINSATGTGDAFYYECGLWGRELNTSEISQLWNNGTGYNPYAPPINETQGNETPVNETPSINHCLADANNDGTVDADDLFAVASGIVYSKIFSQNDWTGDLNDDNVVDIDDIGIVYNSWGEDTSTC